MAPREQFTNLAATTLASAAGSSDATITVASSASFPASGNFRLIIDTELLLCTGVSGVTLTVTRGMEGTTPASHASAAVVAHILTAGGLTALLQDSVPLAAISRPSFRLLDINGNPLTLGNFAINDKSNIGAARQVGNQIQILTQPTGGAYHGTWLLRALTATRPCTIIACVGGINIDDVSPNVNYLGIGLCDSVYGDAYGIVYCPAANSNIGVAGWTDSDTESTWLLSLTSTCRISRAWMKITIDASHTATYSVSADGVNWLVLTTSADYYTHSGNLFNQAFFMVGSNNAQQTSGSLLAWSES